MRRAQNHSVGTLTLSAHPQLQTHEHLHIPPIDGYHEYQELSNRRVAAALVGNFFNLS